MITNNSYLDGIIHRDMRRKLMEDFDQLYILNLHGSSKRKETTPEGGKDENVFDIQQGVSIILMVKGERLMKCVKYSDLYGLREEKYKFLDTHDVKNTSFEFLTPKEKYYFFVKKDLKTGNEYEKFISVKDIFKNYNRGVVTSRDNFVIDDKKEALIRKMKIFIDENLDDQMIKISLNLKDGKKWLVSDARKKLIKKTLNEDLFIEYLYRPFDEKYIFYEDILLERSRKSLMKNLINKNNIALLFMRQVYWHGQYSHFFVTNKATDSRVFISNRGSGDVFPLYIYHSKTDSSELFENKSNNINWTNLPTDIQTIQGFTSKLTNNFIQPTEAIFYYIYAVSYSNIYRQKYQEFLKIDFPRIPFTKDYEVFNGLSSLGEELANLHLLKSKSLDYPSAKFYGQGEGKVEKVEYKDKKVFVNSSQYFSPIGENIYNYFIGGYQVLNKWLKDRRGKSLSLEDIKHYCKVATSLKFTIETQERIDKFYLEVEKNMSLII